MTERRRSGRIFTHSERDSLLKLLRSPDNNNVTDQEHPNRVNIIGT